MEGLDPKIAPKVCDYLKQLEISNTKEDLTLALGIKNSIRLGNELPVETISLSSIVPRLIADVTGHNGWEKGVTVGHTLSIEDELLSKTCFPKKIAER